MDRTNPVLAWHKSSYSDNSGNCVEVAALPAGVAVRDSKNPDGPTLSVISNEWRAFVGSVRAGNLA